MLDLENPPSDLKLGDLSSDLLVELRAVAKESLFFFAKAIVGYKDMSHRTHKGFCDWMQGPSRRKLGLMPRGHFKSSINMADCLRCLAVNPEEQILLVSESSINAESMLEEIKGHITDNPILQAVFPDLIPREYNRRGWTATGIVLPRKEIHRQPSIDTAGITSKIVSRHYTKIFGDDFIADEAMYSPMLMLKAKKFVNRLVSLTVEPLVDEIRVIGTRWAYDDCYGHIIENFPGYDVFIRKAVVQGADGPEPFFLKRFSMEMFQEIIENDPEQWATQYANDPTDTAVADFMPEWLQWFTVAPDRAIRWEDLDGELYRQELDELRYYIHVDPSLGEKPSSDYSGIVVVGLSPAEQIFVVDAIAMRLDPIQLVDKLLVLSQTYHPKLVTIESNAYQKSLVYFLEKEARRKNIGIRIEPSHSPSHKLKGARIRGALIPLFSTRKVWVRRGLTDFVEEYLRFGKSEDEHLMDALAQGPEVWRFPVGPEATKQRKKIASMHRLPRGVTGYGC